MAYNVIIVCPLDQVVHSEIQTERVGQLLGMCPLIGCYVAFLNSLQKVLVHSNVKGGRQYTAQFITVIESGRGWEEKSKEGGSLKLLV